MQDTLDHSEDAETLAKFRVKCRMIASDSSLSLSLSSKASVQMLTLLAYYHIDALPRCTEFAEE
jgi:hypothetical protein